jgi:hypothetical protein
LLGLGDRRVVAAGMLGSGEIIDGFGDAVGGELQKAIDSGSTGCTRRTGP